MSIVINIDKNQEYLDLSLLNNKGKQILKDVYKSLLVTYLYEKNRTYLYEIFSKAYKQNKKYNIEIQKQINISDLIKEINDVIF